MEDSLIIPSKTDRAIALLKLAVPLLCVGVVVAWAHAYRAFVAPLCGCDTLPGIRASVLAASLLLLTLAIVPCRNGIRILRSGQYPPPGTSVLFTRQVQTGWRATIQAISAFAISLGVLVLLGLLLRYAVFSEFGLYLVGIRGCEP